MRYELTKPQDLAAVQGALGISSVLRSDFKTIDRAFCGLHFQRAATGSTPLTPYHDLGQTAVRLWDVYQFTWRRIETSPGVYNWSKLDDLIAKAIQQAARYFTDPEIIINLSQPPAFYTGGVADDSAYPGTYNARPPSDIAKVATWTTALLTHIRAAFPSLPWSSIILEPSNEPNLPQFYNGTVSQLVSIYQAAFTAAKAISQDIRIVGPSSVGTDASLAGAQDGRIGGPAYLDSFLAGGGGAYIDLLGIHLYADYGAEPETLIDHVSAFRSVLRKRGLARPIWCTELGITSWRDVTFGGVFGSSSIGVSILPAQSTAYVWRSMLSALIGGCDRCFFYGVDWPTPGLAVPLVDAASPATVLPAGIAFKRLANLLAGATYQGYATSGALRSAAFSLATGERIELIWCSDFGRVQYDVSKSGAGHRLTDSGTGQYDMPVSVPPSGKVSIGYQPLVVYEQPNRRATPGSGIEVGRWEAVTTNGDYSQDLHSGIPADDWVTSFGSVSFYGGTSLSSRARTYQATAQYQRHAMPVVGLQAGAYKAVISGEGTFANGEFVFGLVDTVGNLLSFIPGSRGSMPGNVGRFYFEREFVVSADYPVLMQLSLQDVAASGWSAISIDRFELLRWVADEPTKSQRKSPLVETSRRPDQTGATCNLGQVYRLIEADGGVFAEGARELYCAKSGTMGTLAGVTANVVSGSRTISGLTGATLAVGQWITLGTSDVPRQVIFRNTATSFDVLPVPDFPQTGAPVQFSPPILIPMGGMGRLLTCKAPGPVITNTAAESSLMPALADRVGTSVIPAGFFKPGRGLRLKFEGVMSARASAPGTLVMKVKVGDAEIPTNPTIAPAAGLNNRAFKGELTLLCREAGPAAVFTCSGGVLFFATLTTLGHADMQQGGGSVSFDTTVRNAVDLRASWAAADASNSVQLLNLTVEAL